MDLEIIDEILNEIGISRNIDRLYKGTDNIGYIWQFNDSMISLDRYVIAFEDKNQEAIELHYADPKFLEKLEEFYKNPVTYKEYIDHLSKMDCDR